MKISIYTKDGCLSCIDVKQLLSTRGVPYTEFKLDEDFTTGHLLSKFPSAKTYPVIVIDDFHIGGINELQARLNEETGNTSKLLLEDEE